MKLLHILVFFIIISIIYFDLDSLQENRITIPTEKITENIWKKVPLIQCICLKERNDRYKQILQEFKNVGIDNVSFYRPTRHKEGGITGCATSHLECLKNAQRQDAPYTLIFEDDCKFVPGIWYDKMIKALDFINTEKNWDLMRIGFIPVNKGVNIGKNIIRGSSITNTGYFISKRAINILIPKLEEYYVNQQEIKGSSRMNVDEFYKFCNLNDYRLDRTICIQRKSKSDNKWPLNVNKICDTKFYEQIQTHNNIINIIGNTIGTVYYDMECYKYFYDYDFKKVIT